MTGDPPAPDQPVPDGPALVASAITKRFGTRAAVSGVGFDVGRGELLAIIGPNGAGKTTLLSILAGVQQPDGGTIEAPGGGDRRIGWVPQQAAVYSKLTVAQNLRLFARLERVADPDGAVERMLDQTDLQARANDELGRLSGGNRQRVNIAVGLLADPAVLLLDEPSAALDPRQRQRLWAFIGSLTARGTSVVFATHDIAEAERHADRVLVLADGELLFDGTPVDLKARAEAAGEGAGAGPVDLEQAFVAFLKAGGH